MTDSFLAYAQRLEEKQVASEEDLAMYRMIDEGRFGIRVGDQIFRLDTEDEQDNLDVEERREAHVVNPYWDYEANAPMNEECPDEVDHRSTHTSIKDQGDRGTCVCFASLAILEAIVKAQSDEELDLSEQYANWLFMKQQGRDQCDDGLRTTLAARYLSANGICEEFHNPYEDYATVQTHCAAAPSTAARSETITFVPTPSTVTSSRRLEQICLPFHNDVTPRRI